MYDDDIGFLGVCFQIARLPITPRVPDLSDTTPHAVREIYNLLGRDIEDNEFSFDRWQRTFTDVIPGFKDIQYPPHQQATDGEWPTINQITVAADILHITCHGGLEDDDGLYWTLSDSQHETTKHQIRDSTIQLNHKKLRKSRTLVFGNACALIASEQNSPKTLTPGFGPAFYENGAAAFVGTCAPITKRVALEFPRKFYEFLLKEGLPIGEALLETKRYFYQQKDYDPTWNDPSWLFYCLYGSPETYFQISS